MLPLVSIIIPTYNREHLIGQTLDSVLNQSYKNWECIIVDDGSQDYTTELIDFYLQRDDRFFYFERPQNRRKGASSCRNFGLSISKGELIQFLDSDDIISSNKLEYQSKLFIKDLNVSITTSKWGRFKNFIGDAEIYDSFKSYKDFEDLYDFLEAVKNSLGFFPIHSFLIRKGIIEESGYWNEFLTMNDDGEFIIRVLLKSHKIAFSEESTAYYRLTSADNLSSYNDINKLFSYLLSLRLIETQLCIRFNIKHVPYVERNKKDFFNHIQHYPEVIKENKDFFKNQLEYSFFKATLRRIFIKIFSLWKNL